MDENRKEQLGRSAIPHDEECEHGVYRRDRCFECEFGPAPEIHKNTILKCEDCGGQGKWGDRSGNVKQRFKIADDRAVICLVCLSYDITIVTRGGKTT